LESPLQALYVCITSASPSDARVVAPTYLSHRVDTKHKQIPPVIGGKCGKK